jgi:hypothetical protein
MYPPDGVSFRGGGLPLQFVTQLAGHPPPFYVAGKKYRVPMFLASSFNKHLAENFCISAEARFEAPVIWTIKVDARGALQPQYRCKHVNQASARCANIAPLSTTVTMHDLACLFESHGCMGSGFKVQRARRIRVSVRARIASTLTTARARSFARPDPTCSYSPYSVMTVESVALPMHNAQASVANPIRIVIVAALDNRLEAPDLPLAPWA